MNSQAMALPAGVLLAFQAVLGQLLKQCNRPWQILGRVSKVRFGACEPQDCVDFDCHFGTKRALVQSLHSRPNLTVSDL